MPAVAEGRGGEEEEGGDDEESVGRRPASTTPVAAAATASPATAPTPRLRTRLFAARCLARLPALACGADPRHATPRAASSAGRAGKGAAEPDTWLVGRLQRLVDLGYRMATGQLEVSPAEAGHARPLPARCLLGPPPAPRHLAQALRPCGARLLRAVVTWFGAAPDPELPPGHRLLEQYQAQLVSALRWGAVPLL